MQKIRFLLGGALGVGTYYLALWFLTEKIGFWYLGSSILAFFLNFSINFVIQKFWTFKDRQTETAGRQMLQYFAMAIGFLVTNTILLYVLVEYVHLWYITAQVILTVVLTIVSFVITRRIFSSSTP